MPIPAWAAGLAWRFPCQSGAFRIDFVVERNVLVEVKSVEHTLEVHKAQVITYLRLSGLPVGPS